MKLKRILKTVAILFIFGYIGLTVEIGYYVVRPSRAVDLGEIIALDITRPGIDGKFYLVTVSQQKATLFSAVYGFFHPHMDLNPVSVVIPENMDIDQYRELMQGYMMESQYIAQVVALRRAGYEIAVHGEGVKVTGFLTDAPADGFLVVGDIIIEVDGEKVTLASEVSTRVRDRLVGDTVELLVLRGEDELKLVVPTGLNPENKETPFLGIYIESLPWVPEVPVSVTIDTGKIGGPSAGLMFVLELLNQSLPEDITRGKKIAGTGSIDLNENVGRIGGVKQKVITAEMVGAEYFFVPVGNYDEAAKAAKTIILVPVSNLEETLKFLYSLDD